jgi:hypothetical protein
LTKKGGARGIQEKNLRNRLSQLYILTKTEQLITYIALSRIKKDDAGLRQSFAAAVIHSYIQEAGPEGFG